MAATLASTWIAGCSPPASDGDDVELRLLPSADLVVPREVPVSAIAALTGTYLDLGKEVRVDDRDAGPTWLVAGTAGGELGAGARLGKSSLATHVVARGPFTLWESSVVIGDVVAAGTVSFGTDAHVSGVTHANAPLAAPRVLSLQTSFPAPAGSHYLETSGTKRLELAPGSYDQISIEADTELVLDTGTYHVRRLKMLEGGLITFASKQGTSIVYVRDELLLDGRVDAVGAVANAAIVSMASDDLSLPGPFAGHLFAPLAAVKAGAGGPLVGGVAARELYLADAAELDHEPFAGWAQLLALGEDPPPENPWVAPAVCETPQMCCHATMAFVAGSAGIDAVDVVFADACIHSEGGNDSIVGFAADSVAIAGDGDDFISLGVGARVHGGTGNDVIEALADSIVFGNAGDDLILIPGGANVVTPGPGRDRVELGTGDDTIIIADPCELQAGEVLDGGDGHDVLVSALSLAQLGALGVEVRNIEAVQIERHGCTSECRAVPECGPAGVCSESTNGTLSCTCDDFADGLHCQNELEPKYESTPAPNLGAVSPGNERATAEAFVDWMARARVGDESTISDQLDLARADPAIRDALVAVAADVFASGRPAVVIPAIEAISYLRCRACEKQLQEFVAAPLRHGGEPVPGIYGLSTDDESREASRQIARAAIGGLAFQATKSSRASLLAQIAAHPDRDVRVMAIRAIRAVYRDTYDADIAAVAQPSELVELDRPL